MNVTCQFCGSKIFRFNCPPEEKFTTCCHKERVQCKKPINSERNILSYSNFLLNLPMDPSNPDRKNFCKNIRSYSSVVSFASARAKIVNFNGCKLLNFDVLAFKLLLM